MNIRSITYLDDSEYPMKQSRIEAAGRFLNEARTAFESAGLKVQTTRLAMPPFGSVPGVDSSTVVGYARDFDGEISAHHIDYATYRPGRPD